MCASGCRPLPCRGSAGSSIFEHGAAPGRLLLGGGPGRLWGGLDGAQPPQGTRWASNSRPIRTIPCAAHVWWRAFRGRRHVYARRGAAQRPRLDRPRRGRCRRCRRRRRRRLRRPRAPRAPSRGAACWALAAGGGWWCYGCMPPPAPGGAGVASAGSGPARRSPTVMLRPRAGAVPLVCCPRSCLCVCLVCEKDCEIVEIAISQYLKKNQLCYRLSASLNWWIVRCTFRRNRRRSTRKPWQTELTLAHRN